MGTVDIRAVDLGKGVRPGRVSLGLPKSLDFEEWREIGRRLAAFGNAGAWWVADWALYARFKADAAWSGRYEEMMVELGLDYQTIANRAFVAAAIPPDRRRERLSFSHHAEVASMPEQHQEQWLDRADLEGWTRDQLRQAVKSAKALPGPDDGDVVVTILRVQVPAAREERWRTAAARAGVELEAAIADAVDAWATDVLAGEAAAA